MGGVMSSVVISGDTSGSITLSAPAVAGTNTATLPAASGVLQVSGNMPAFGAYLSATQSISSTTWTKVTIDTEDFDTNNNFASSRFTPTVAGYYQINGTISLASTGTNPTSGIVSIYKNGSAFKTAGIQAASSAPQICVSSIIYFNGSTDYVELYGYINGAVGPQFNSGTSATYFNGCLVRSA